MGTTTNLGLTTTPENTELSFKEWRMAMNGESDDSNMNKIDTAIGLINDAINLINESKGASGGFATLNESGIIPEGQLPSYVDDVIEVASESALNNLATRETGKIYVVKATNLCYRWSGSTFVPIASNLALGTTSDTAFAGDKGQTAYTHATTTGNPHSTSYSDVGAAASSHTHAQSDITNLDTTLGNLLPKSGGAMTGCLSDVMSKQVRNIFFSQNNPSSSDGNNGDIWIVCETMTSSSTGSGGSGKTGIDSPDSPPDNDGGLVGGYDDSNIDGD